MRHVVALALALALLGDDGVAWAQTASSGNGAKNVLLGVGSGVATVLYTPFKATMCVVGAAPSLLVLLESGATAMKAVAGRACGGTWYITPAELTGEQPIDFVGDSIKAPAP